MTSHSIYTILASKPHNDHYLKRYIKFIKYCQTLDFTGLYIENHHICPKAKDLFPEYKSFKKNPWNKISLPDRYHFIAHWLLWKTFGGSQILAFMAMSNNQNPKQMGRQSKRINSKTYSILKNNFKITFSEQRKGLIAAKDINKIPIGLVKVTDTRFSTNEIFPMRFGYVPCFDIISNKKVLLEQTDEKIKNGICVPIFSKLSKGDIGYKRPKMSDFQIQNLKTRTPYIRTEKHRKDQSNRNKNRIYKSLTEDHKRKISKPGTIWMHNIVGKNIRVSIDDLEKAINQGCLIGYAPGTHPNLKRKSCS